MTAAGVTNRKRLLVLLLIFTLIFFGLIIRVGYIQLVWGVDLQKKAVDQWTRDLDVYPRRGSIKDRNGKILAQSATSESIAARPSQIADPAKAASMIAPILDLDEQELKKKLSNTSSSYIWIKRQVDGKTANEIRPILRALILRTKTAYLMKSGFPCIRIYHEICRTGRGIERTGRVRALL